MRVSYFLLASLVASSPPPCSLNGVLSPTTGECACVPGWGGTECETLLLLPSSPLTSATQVYYHPSSDHTATWHSNSWGIFVLPDDSGSGVFHGYMTELEGNCSLSSYGAASRILHVTSSTPTGPWVVVDVALPSFAHNPQVVRDVDGAWLLYHIGSEEKYCHIDCSTGKIISNSSCSGATHGSGVARSLTPYGPWEVVPYILPNNETNPSAIVLGNGSIVITARRWEGGVPMYTAPSWRGPYTLLPLAPVLPVPTPNTTAVFDEDPYLYVQKVGGVDTYHMLTHRQPLGTYCSPTQNPDASDCRCAGGHMFAENLLEGPWYFDLRLVFNCTLEVQEGANSNTTIKLHARQRPTLLFENGGCPLLYTGASSDPVSQYYSSFTMAQSVSC